MEQSLVNSRLTPEQRQFFDNLTSYIGRDLYFYGSIQRPDYIKGKSDVDIDIFTDNENSTIHHLCAVLNLPKTAFKPVIYKINNETVHSYKGKYGDEEIGVSAEISVHKEKYKQAVLDDRNQSRDLPYFVTLLLYIIKVVYYNLQLISSKTYARCKRFLMNQNDELKFIEVDA